jgi:hypothetical protein
LEVEAMLKFSALLLMCAGVCLPAYGQAQSSSIPDTRVPGFGGTDTRPGSPGSAPSSSGTAVGSNVGAGSTASPIADPATPPMNGAPSVAEAPPAPLLGISRPLPVTK